MGRVRTVRFETAKEKGFQDTMEMGHNAGLRFSLDDPLLSLATLKAREIKPNHAWHDDCVSRGSTCSV